MALKATIFKVQLELADMDRHIYAEHSLTLARHPSETDERMLMRLLAFALNAPADNERGELQIAKDMWDPDEPGLWQKDHTGQLVHWIEVGQPDEKRLLRVSARCEKVTVYCFSSSATVWWEGIRNKLTRAQNLEVWQVPAEESEALGAMARRSMQVLVTVQDGSVYISQDDSSVEIHLRKLYP